MKFLLGSKKNFLDFLENISKEDNVAILTHNDLDGIASAIFLEEILNKRGIKVKTIKFSGYGKGTFDDFSLKLSKNKISKVFITDMAADLSGVDEFERLRKIFEVFLIDHHPISPDLINKKNIVKTESGDCSSFVIYNFGKFGSEWDWLISSSIIADMAYKKEENFEFLKAKNSDIKKEDVHNSKIGKMENIISFALIYYKSKNLDLRDIYELIKNKNFEDLEKYYQEVKDEIDFHVKRFEKKAEVYPDKKISFYLFKSKLDIGSVLSTLISIKNPENTFIVMRFSKGFININARNQAKIKDMNLLLKKGIKDLKNSNGGGHIPAAGGRIMKKDLRKFKQNVLGQ